MGDTAWELFQRLNLKDAAVYLDDRSAKGFTAIQAVALAELDGLNAPNAQGALPLLNNDPTRPNEDYFRHVDAIVELERQRGLIIGMLPTWGDKVHKQWGGGPVIFDEPKARIYGGCRTRAWLPRDWAQVPGTSKRRAETVTRCSTRR